MFASEMPDLLDHGGDSLRTSVRGRDAAMGNHMQWMSRRVRRLKVQAAEEHELSDRRSGKGGN